MAIGSTGADIARSGKELILDHRGRGWAIAGACGAMAAVGLAWPLAALPLGVVGLLAARLHTKTGKAYPLRVPAGDASPGGGDGIFFLGNEVGTSKEVWLSNDDLRQHMLIVGPDSPEKSDLVVSAAANALARGSSFIMVSASGDTGMYARLYGLCREFHREDDLLVANIIRGHSHRMNPFRTGSPEALARLLTDLMDDDGGAMWRGRATAMVSGLLRILCWLRDNKGFELDTASLRDHLSMRLLVEIVAREDIPVQVTRGLASYLTSLPGFKGERGVGQSQTTLDQHGYLEMSFTRILGSLSDVHGHIFTAGGVDIDMDDVVLNRRNLLVLLPSLERSHDEMCNMARIVVSMLRDMMGRSLGSKLEGTWEEVVDKRPWRGSSPCAVILDECGHYLTPGTSLMAAQARSMGFSMVYATQDIPAMKRLDEKEAESIIANTNTTVIMRTEDSKSPGDPAATKPIGPAGHMEVKCGEIELDVTGFAPGTSGYPVGDVAVSELLTLGHIPPSEPSTLSGRAGPRDTGMQDIPTMMRDMMGSSLGSKLVTDAGTEVSMRNRETSDTGNIPSVAGPASPAPSPDVKPVGTGEVP